MSDDIHYRGPADRRRINIHDFDEVQYWKKKFGVTKEELERAVNKVGVSVEKVQKVLRK
jgi:hypothetical protein